MNLPTPFLGKVTAITITSPDLAASLVFYQQLGFSELMRMDFPFPWILISDGALMMMLRQDNTPYLALTYYVKDIAQIAQALEAKGIVFKQKPSDNDFVKRYLFQTPDLFNISLVNLMDGFHQPKGATMLGMNPSDYANPDAYVNKSCGMFGELAHPVADLDASIAYWEQLGFAVLSQFSFPYPWAIISDGLAIVGLHQTTNFNYAAITYFASDMTQKIEALKQKGLANFVVNHEGNIVVTTPEQQHINLFSLGM